MSTFLRATRLACALSSCLSAPALAQDVRPDPAASASMPAVVTETPPEPPAAPVAPLPVQPTPAPVPVTVAPPAAAAALTLPARPTLPAAEPAEALSRFSVGAGLGVYGSSATGSLALAALGGTSDASPTPVGVALVELALTRALRVSLGAAGSYRHSEGDSYAERLPDDPDGAELDHVPTDSKQWAGGLRAGLRYVLNPQGVVEVSPLVSVGWSRGRRESKADTSDSDGAGDTTSTNRSYDVQLGLVLERKLLPQLYLRFESSVAQYAYRKTYASSAFESVPRVQRGTESTLGLAFSPALQLRLVF